jgi:hypothetical protein
MNTKLFVDWDGTIIQWDRLTKTSSIAWDNLEYIQRVVGETITEVVIFSMGIGDSKDAKAFLKNKSKLIAKAFPNAKVYVLPFYDAFMSLPRSMKSDKYADMTISKETMLEFYLRAKKVEGRVVFFDDTTKRVKTTLDFGTFNAYPVFGGYQYEYDNYDDGSLKTYDEGEWYK